MERFFRTEARVLRWRGKQLGCDEIQIILRRRDFLLAVSERQGPHSDWNEEQSRPAVIGLNIRRMDRRILPVNRLKNELAGLRRLRQQYGKTGRTIGAQACPRGGSQDAHRFPLRRFLLRRRFVSRKYRKEHIDKRLLNNMIGTFMLSHLIERHAPLKQGFGNGKLQLRNRKIRIRQFQKPLAFTRFLFGESLKRQRQAAFNAGIINNIGQLLLAADKPQSL